MRKVMITVSNPELQEMCLAIQEQREGMRKLFIALVHEATGRPLNRAEWVATMILTRATECIESVELLVAYGRDRDPAILLLSLLELEYDLKYISQGTDRADTWFEHSAKGRKPWTVAFLINSLHPDPSDREAAWETYRQFSMVKHGNPASGTFGFPLGKHGNILCYRFQEPPDLLIAYLFTASTIGQAITAAALSCFSSSSPAIAAIDSAVGSASKRVTRLMELRIIQILREVGLTEA